MKKLQVLFLGTGNGLQNDPGNYHSNLVVSHGEDNLFIDCGSHFDLALHDAGLSYKDIRHMYISHVHSDHAGGLEWLGFANHFGPQPESVSLYCVRDIKKDLDTMLRPSMSASIKDFKKEGLASCFDFEFANGGFTVGSMHCQPIKTLHVNAYAELYSYGLFIEADDESILFTSDTQFSESTWNGWYKKADLILHDCSTGPEPYAAHAHISQLNTLPKDIKKKMYLYHYGPGIKKDAVKMGFAGYAKQREVISAPRMEPVI